MLKMRKTVRALKEGAKKDASGLLRYSFQAGAMP